MSMIVDQHLHIMTLKIKKNTKGSPFKTEKFFCLLALFWAGSGITLLGGGGTIMARMGSSHPEAVCRHPKAQK